MESENIFNKYCTKSLAKIKSSVITSLGNNDDSAINGCIEYNSAFKVKDWNDELLIELGKVWDKNDFELVDLTNESYTVELKGLPAIAIPGIFNPFLEYKNYDGQLYVKCSEKIKHTILKDKFLFNKFKELNPQIKFDMTSTGKLSRIERAKMTPQLREAILRRDNYTCQICGKVMGPDDLFEVDHIIPIAKGGRTEESNLQTLCWKCNREKGARFI